MNIVLKLLLFLLLCQCDRSISNAFHRLLLSVRLSTQFGVLIDDGNAVKSESESIEIRNLLRKKRRRLSLLNRQKHVPWAFSSSRSREWPLLDVSCVDHRSEIEDFGFLVLNYCVSATHSHGHGSWGPKDNETVERHKTRFCMINEPQ